MKQGLSSAAYWTAVALALALGTWLRAPSLRGVLMSDDWDHYAMVEGIHPNARAPWDLYNFVSADPGERRDLLSSGRLPWWSAPDIHLGFLRPLSSLSVWIDYAVLGARHAPLHAHLHSVLWWLAGALGVAAVFRLVLPPLAAGLAVLLYAVDDAHALPVAWSASRSELIAVAFMSWALWALLEWHRRGLSRHRWLAVGLVWLGMLSGEHAVALLALLVAAELFSDSARSWKALLPLGLPLAFYVLTRGALGYGAASSTFYVDPVGEPGRFLRALRDYVPLLAADLGLGYPVDYLYGGGLPDWLDFVRDHLPAAWLAPESLWHFQWSCGLLVLAATALFWIWLGRRATDAPARKLRWLIAGALAALIPLASALPMTRLALVPGLAFHAVFAWLAVEAWQVLRSPRPLRWSSRCVAGVFCALLLALHVVHPAFRCRSLSASYARVGRVETHWVLDATLPDAWLPGRHVIVLSAWDVATAFALPFVRHFGGRSMPASSELLLPPVRGTLQLRRPDARTIELESAREIVEFSRSAYRPGTRDFQPGQRWQSERFSVEVLAIDRGLPRHLRFVFARPLEDPSYLFVYPMRAGLMPFSLPPVGAMLTLPQPAVATGP